MIFSVFAIHNELHEHIADVLITVQLWLGLSHVGANYSLSNWIDFAHDANSVADRAGKVARASAAEIN